LTSNKDDASSTLKRLLGTKKVIENLAKFLIKTKIATRKRTLGDVNDEGKMSEQTVKNHDQVERLKEDQCRSF
jgi:hypothetical protein